MKLSVNNFKENFEKRKITQAFHSLLNFLVPSTFMYCFQPAYLNLKFSENMDYELEEEWGGYLGEGQKGRGGRGI